MMSGTDTTEDDNNMVFEMEQLTPVYEYMYSEFNNEICISLDCFCSQNNRQYVILKKTVYYGNKQKTVEKNRVDGFFFDLHSMYTFFEQNENYVELAYQLCTKWMDDWNCNVSPVNRVNLNC